MIHESEVAINVTIIFLSSCPQLNELVHPSYQKKKKEIHDFRNSLVSDFEKRLAGNAKEIYNVYCQGYLASKAIKNVKNDYVG